MTTAYSVYLLFASFLGLINDPYLDGTCRINTGLRVARKLMLDIQELGLPVACEMLDTISPQFIADLMTW